MMKSNRKKIYISRFGLKLGTDPHLWIEIELQPLSLHLKAGINYSNPAFNIGFNIIIVEKIQIIECEHIKGGHKSSLVVSCYPYIILRLKPQRIGRSVMPYLLI